MYQEIVDWINNQYRCEFCGKLSENPLTEGLCEDCYDTINNDELIGYRKGE